MNKKIKVIGITGPAHCGKDTAADYLLKHLPFGFTKASFADPIKEMARGLGLTYGQLYGNLKDVTDPALGCTPRKILQTLGTEWGRELIHPDVWVRAMVIKLQGLENGAGFVMPDVRFENEANFVREHGVLIHITGRFDNGDSQVEQHVSESGVKLEPGDIPIRNDDLIDTFYDYLAETMRLINEY
ncbi:MAG: deoxynucleotide monophosphate kinase [candidate division Zixibacteria bacterium]|nr:deoxynucleotide monophosphate kinase [candidate division Zixibacteria bacterium]